MPASIFKVASNAFTPIPRKVARKLRERRDGGIRYVWQKRPGGERGECFLGRDVKSGAREEEFRVAAKIARCRMPFGDTAGCQPALQAGGRLSEVSRLFQLHPIMEPAQKHHCHCVKNAEGFP